MSLASIFLIPSIAAGLGLVVFQTFSFFTGKSFKDLNFDIGRLWEYKESGFLDEPITEDNVVYYSSIKQSTKAIEKPKLSFVGRQNLPKVKSRVVLDVKQGDYESNIGTKYFSKDLDSLQNIEVKPFAQNQLLLKYFTRLDNEYLINPNIVGKSGKWYVGLSLAPTLNFRSFRYNTEDISGILVDGNYRYTFGLTEDARNSSDRFITSFSAGFDFGRRLTNRLRVYSGLYYSTYGEQIQISSVCKLDPNYAVSSFVNKKPEYRSFSTSKLEDNIPYSNKYSFIEIPIGLTYDLVVKPKSKISVEGGINLQRLDNVNALVYDFETDYYYWLTSKKEQLFTMKGIGFSTGVSISQFIDNRLEMFINPNFKYNLKSTFIGSYPVSQNQYSTGIRLGFRHHLK